MLFTCALLAVLGVWSTCMVVEATNATCDGMLAQTESGPVCGKVRESGDGCSYASFRGVPYAKQPLGALRFKELQPAEPWDFLEAFEEGPVCPQKDNLYGPLLKPSGMNESCIHANIHVPLDALPAYNSTVNETECQGIPIIVSIHGGGFAYGSGDDDVYGPEFLVSNGVIVITFNYRINVFGFFSLNTTNVPGNNALRDMVTLLKWVQRNAQFFGGDPTQVTIAGQSAGAAAAHLLTLSDATEGLFQRAIIMSGSAVPTFYTTKPVYAQTMASALTQLLGINSTDPEVIYQELITMPIEQIMAANEILQNETGLIVFYPVTESPFSGVTTILDADPEELITSGKGKDIPLIVGYTNVEAETFRHLFEENDILAQLDANPLIILPAPVIYSESAAEMAAIMTERYLGENRTIDAYLNATTDNFFKYASLKTAQYRHATGGAPLYLYRFSYNSDNSMMKAVLGLNYTGACHIEDLTYVFKVNSVQVTPSSSDISMRNLMTNFVTNFVISGNPTEDSSWTAVTNETLQYLNIVSPSEYQSEELTEEQTDILNFYDSIRGTNSSTS